MDQEDDIEEITKEGDIAREATMFLWD